MGTQSITSAVHHHSAPIPIVVAMLESTPTLHADVACADVGRMEFANPERPECANLLAIYQIVSGKSREVRWQADMMLTWHGTRDTWHA